MNREHEYELEQDLSRFEWHDVEVDPPPQGDLVIATDGEARWLDMAHAYAWNEPGRGMTLCGFGPKLRVATHWHTVREIPTHIKRKSPAAVSEPEIMF